jgi:hypothetical protein
MADLEKSQSSKPGMDEKLRRDIPGKGGQAGGEQGDLLKGRQPAARAEARSGAMCRTIAKKGTRKSQSRLAIKAANPATTSGKS